MWSFGGSWNVNEIKNYLNEFINGRTKDKKNKLEGKYKCINSPFALTAPTTRNEHVVAQSHAL